MNLSKLLRRPSLAALTSLRETAHGFRQNPRTAQQARPPSSAR